MNAGARESLERRLGLGGEVVRPSQTIPRSILTAILVVCALSFAMNLSIISVVPWRDATQSPFVVSDFVLRHHSLRFASAMTLVILVLAMASLYANMLTFYLMIGAVPVVPAVVALRRSRPDIARPFRMWLFPLPGVVAMSGWVFIIAISGWKYIASGAGVIAVGIAAYLWRAREAGEWPFKEEHI